MGLFDKIKDNAKNISMRALYEEVPDESVIAEGSTDAAATISSDKEIVDFEDRPIEASDSKPSSESKSDFIDIDSLDKDASKPAKAADKVEVKKTVSTRPVIKKPVAAPKKIEHSPVNHAGKPKVIDVAPQRGVLDPARKSLYARERAAMVALAARRRMDGTVPIYTTNHQTFRTRIFIDRIEYSGSFGKNNLPIEQVAWIKLRAGGTGVILETLEGKRVVMVIKPKDRLAFADAVMKVQGMQPKRVKFKDTQTIRIDQLDKIGEGVDEIEKLAKLFDKGIISQEEFDLKKKQILGI